MAARPIISIDVDDAAFKRFVDLFNAYDQKLGEQPETWKALDEAMAGAGKTLETGALSGKEALALAAAQAEVIGTHLAAAVKAQHEFGRATHSSNKGLKELVDTAGGLGKKITGIASSLLKFGAIGIGLGAIGSGLGIDALAGAALSRSRSAGGLGVSPGQLASFQVNAQRYLGTGALSSAADAQSDLRKAGYLAALGIDYRKAQGESTSDLAFDELKAARAAWLRAPKGMAMQMPAVSSYLALGGNVGDIRNAALSSLSDINAAQFASQRDAASLELGRKQQQEWIQLKIAMDKAGLSIQSALIDKLAPLAPQFTRLSQEVVGAINTFLNSRNVGVAINDLKNGVKGVADILARKDVQDGFSKLATFIGTTDWGRIGADIMTFGADVVKALTFLKIIPTVSPKTSHAAPTDIQLKHLGFQYDAGDKEWTNPKTGQTFDPANNLWGHKADNKVISKGLYYLSGAWLKDLVNQHGEIALRGALGDYSPDRIHALNQLAESQYKLPAGIMDRLAMDESGYGKNLISPAGALGPYQFMPDTAKGLGINPFNTRQASDAAAKMLDSLYKKYGSWDKAVAAYNMGPAALDADIKQHGAAWLRYAPAETRGEVSNVVGSNASGTNSAIVKALGQHAKALRANTAAKTRPTQVSITNSTAARVAVSINAASVV